jgi:hypothetical protein
MNLARANIAKNQSCEPADVALVYLATSLDYVIRFFAHLTVDRS